METIHPFVRILNTLIKPLLNNRGEVDAGEEPESTPASPAPVSNWKDSIPDEIRQDPVFDKYKEPADVYRAFVGTQKFLGREKLPVPRDANDKETYDLIFKKLGVPESPDKYELPKDYKIPEGVDADNAMFDEFKKVAHKHNVLPGQFNEIYKWYMESAANYNEKFNKFQEDSLKEAESNLRKEWGSAYKQNVTLAQKVIQNFGDKATLEELEKGLGNNPAMVKFIANIGKALSEDQLSGSPRGMELTPTEAQSEISKIKGDMKHPYWDKNHPNHKEAVDSFQRLMKFTIAGK